MKRYPLVGGSIVIVLVLVLGSLTNVVGFHTVQSSQQHTKKEAINQRELLFQTLVDFANNKEIQQILLKSQISRGLVLPSEIPVFIKTQLKRMYLLGLILSKFMSTSRVQSMVQTDQVMTPDLQQVINAVIEKDSVVQEDITRLVASGCGCDKSEWGFPIICTTLLVMMGLVFIPWLLLMIIFMIPPGALDEMLELLFLFLSPLLLLYQRFNCPVPQENKGPWYSDISPADGEQNVSLSLSEIRFRIYDPEGDLMSYKVTTSPDIGSGSATLVPNGTYAVPVHGLENHTTYSWHFRLYAGDDSGTPLGKTFTFTTSKLAPFIWNPSPRHTADYVPIFTPNVSFNLKDFQGDLMNWTVETHPDIGGGSGTNVSDGHYSVGIHGLDYNTTYTWFVNATDGLHWTRRTYAFTTSPEGMFAVEPSDDTFVDHGNPDTPRGSGGRMNVRNEYGATPGFAYDPLIRFDVSSIPKNITLQDAYLRLYYCEWDDNNPSGRPLRLYRATSPWEEETVTWNTQPSYEDVWTSFALVPGSAGTWIEWNVTKDVRAFVNESLLNYGWKITDETPWNNYNIPIVKLYANEFGAFIPHLSIAYETK
ncbi:MAG: DNRLRE domain-containing protein [Candidatus Thermoplasmatota archaeon]|nr:DNRLRE domain-containing protein [Candidatus Thermoplasmatota archaeon]